MKKTFLIFLTALVLLAGGFLFQLDERQKEDWILLPYGALTYFEVGVDVGVSEKYGNYLKFDDTQTFTRVHTSLYSLYDNHGYEWSQNFDFVSLNEAQKKQDQTAFFEPENHVNWYPDETFANLLNNDGYVMVGDTLYQDTNNGQLVYVIDKNGEKTVFYDANERPQIKKYDGKTLDCFGGNVVETKQDNGCDVGNDVAYFLEGQIVHWRNWITGHETVLARGYQYAQDCETKAVSKHMADVTQACDHAIFGSDWSASGDERVLVSESDYLSLPFEYNQNDGLCIERVACTHTAQFDANTTLVVETEIVAPASD